VEQAPLLPFTWGEQGEQKLPFSNAIVCFPNVNLMGWRSNKLVKNVLFDQKRGLSI